jgi:hypothetical protein
MKPEDSDFTPHEELKDIEDSKSKVSKSTPISSVELWNGLEYYYEMGLSMIWSRIEKEVVNGVEKAPKTPLGRWKSAQMNRFSLKELSRLMHTSNVQIAPTIVCGAVSGNLEIIDLDVKYWPGIDVIYFSEVKSLYPELYERLRIHRTQSGGYHILYRVLEAIKEGNRKLATQKDAKEAGIETRGEGGYALCPPGAGYRVFRDVPIPVISLSERNALITIAVQLNEKIKIIAPKKEKFIDSHYKESPFDNFNLSNDGENILIQFGWKPYQETARYIHYTRPGKDKGISASWIKEYRCFHIFTSSSELDPDYKNRGTYSPSAVLIMLRFNGDGKAAFKFLVDSGYGKVLPHVEAKTVKAYAKDPKKSLPANFSAESKQSLVEEREKYQTKYPYGTFWIFDEEYNIYKVSLTKILNVLNELGVSRFGKHLIHIQDNIFKYIDEADVLSMLSEYFKDEEDAIKINDVLLAKWKSYGEFLLRRNALKKIEKKQMLRSTSRVDYKVFLNGVLEITKDSIVLVPDISSYGKLINEFDVIQAHWKEVPESEYFNCKYVKFLRLAFATDWKYVQKVIGFLCYNYKRRGKGYLIALLEGLPKGVGGGSGKGLFFELLGDSISFKVDNKGSKKWSSMIAISGRQIEKGEAEMLQMWNGEWIVHFSDVPKNLDISNLKDVITDGGSVKKLYQDVFKVVAEDYPNIGLSSQWGIDPGKDSGSKRRLRKIILSNYFNHDHEVRDEFDGDFPDCWDDPDWLGYYNYIAFGIQAYMIAGKLEPIKDNEPMWQKTFDQTYGNESSELRDWISDKAQDWAEKEYLPNTEFQHAYETFCRSDKGKYTLYTAKLHEAFEKWCEWNGYDYKHGIRKWVDGQQQRCIVITKLNTPSKKQSAIDQEAPPPF